MFVVDNQHDWMADLDWTLHGPKSRQFANDRQFLAETLERIAELATGEWPDDIPFLLAKAGSLPAGEFLPSDLVFDADGNRTSLYDEAEGAAREHARLHRIPLRVGEPITPEEWRLIEDEAVFDLTCGDAARLVWSQLAPLFASLAFRGRVSTWIEPIHGGAKPQPLEKEFWRLAPDDAVRRCARCGIDPDRPLDSRAVVTHYIFVDDHDLQQAVHDAAHENYIVRLEPDWRLKRLIDARDVPTRLLRRYLADMIRSSRDVLTYGEMQDRLEQRFRHRPSERAIVALRNQVLAEDDDLLKLYRRTGPRVRRPDADDDA